MSCQFQVDGKVNQLCMHACQVMSFVYYSLPPYGLQLTRLHEDSPSKNTRMGCYFFLQGIFLTEGSNPRLLHLLYWQAGSLPLCHLGSPNQLYMYIYPFFFRLFSHIGHYRVFSKIPCAIQQNLLVIYFIYSTVSLPHLSHGDHKLVFYICSPISVLQISSFMHFFRFLYISFLKTFYYPCIKFYQRIWPVSFGDLLIMSFEITHS